MDAARIDTPPALETSADRDADAPSRSTSFGGQFASMGSRLLLGSATGAWVGLVVGGFGGRIAMFLLRLTSPDAVIGRTSDDGFEIGRISIQSLFLFIVTAVLGAMAGIAYVIARPALPQRWRLAAWSIVGGALGGSTILHADGIDFSVLHPRGLSVAMFIAIPAASSAAIVMLVERRLEWWWVDRRRTIVACLPLLPAMLFFFLPLFLLAALLVVSAAATSSHLRRIVRLVGPTLVRGLLLIVATWSAWNLIRDVTAIL